MGNGTLMMLLINNGKKINRREIYHGLQDRSEFCLEKWINYVEKINRNLSNILLIKSLLFVCAELSGVFRVKSIKMQ